MASVPGGRRQSETFRDNNAAWVAGPGRTCFSTENCARLRVQSVRSLVTRPAGPLARHNLKIAFEFAIAQCRHCSSRIAALVVFLVALEFASAHWGVSSHVHPLHA